MIVATVQQAEEIKRKVYKIAEDTVEQLKSLMKTNTPIELLFEMKFHKIGFDPIEGTELNIIEQVNQLFSDLVVMEALKHLLLKYPEKSFRTHLGAESGFDIESTDRAVVAECFAVTTASSNGKLKKDSEKLVQKAMEQEKYIFFYSENDIDSKLVKVYEKFPEITFIRVAKL